MMQNPPDVRRVAQTDGALHEISAIVYRDWLITFDLVENRLQMSLTYVGLLRS